MKRSSLIFYTSSLILMILCRHMREATVFCICIIFVLAVHGTTSQWIRGASPEEQAYYKAETFKCRTDPTKVFSATRINDNYCDCQDGSDEPGTSACVNGIFYCENKGYRVEPIFSSRVNDGICDCCDGGDEYEYKVQCVNTCEELGAQLRKQQQEEKEKLERGLQIRNQWIEDAEKTLVQKREDVEKYRLEVDKLKKVVEGLEAEKKGFEEKEAEERKVMAERQLEIDRLEQERLARENPVVENEVEQEQQLKELLKQQEQPQGEGQESNTEKPQETPPPAEPPKPTTPEDSELLKGILEGIDETDQSIFLRWVFNLYKDAKSWIKNWLISTHVISTEQEKQTQYLIEEKRKVEDELSRVKRDLTTAENDLHSTEDFLKLDFGPNKEYLALHGNCYEHKTREYTYSFCPFGEVKQAYTSLGKFEKWDPPYTAMSHTNGQQCWGGPKRSAKVTLLCGAENTLYDVQEPAKCEYSMKFSTPAACTPNTLEFLEHVGVEGHHH